MKHISIDFHCHPLLPPLSRKIDNIWFSETLKDNDRRDSANFLGINTAVVGDYTQSGFGRYGYGNQRLAVISLYPIEQGFLSDIFKGRITGKEWSKFIDDFLKTTVAFDENNELTEKNRCLLARLIFQMDEGVFKEVIDENRSYFQALEREYNFLLSQKNTNPTHLLASGKKMRLCLAKDYKELSEYLNIDDNYNYGNADDNNLVAVLSIEGGHSFLNEIHPKSDNNTKLKVLKNIQTVKKWEFAPLFVTFSHHFWNYLCGHSVSFFEVTSRVWDQDEGLNQGFTELGKNVLMELLSYDEGRRILIDIKHLSIKGRKFYYEFLEKQKDDSIPIIASHMGVNGKPCLEDGLDTEPSHELADEKYLSEAGIFNPWNINLFDDEIVKICKSRGIIGLNFDQRILSSEKMICNIMNNTNGKYYATHADILRSYWAQPVLENFMHIQKVIAESPLCYDSDKNYAWEMVCIGSDFEGFINPVDAFCCADDFEIFREVFITKLEIRATISNVEPYLYEKRNMIEKIVDNFMYKNVLRFLKTYFNDAYLKKHTKPKYT